jgi:hypothetical protein
VCIGLCEGNEKYVKESKVCFVQHRMYYEVDSTVKTNHQEIKNYKTSGLLLGGILSYAY